MVLTKQKSQLAESLALNFSQIHPVISLSCRSFNLNITWLNILRTARMQRLGPRTFQLGLSWFVHLEPNPFWEPNQGSGDLSETPKARSRAKMKL